MADIKNSGANTVRAILSTLKNYTDATFVAKEEGKGLSTNDFTNELKATLEGMGGAVDAKIEQALVATDGKIEAALKDITGVSFVVVNELPPIEGYVPGTILLLDTDGEAGEAYEQYIVSNGEYIKIGSTDIDLSNYATKQELAAVSDIVDTCVKHNEIVEITDQDVSTIWATINI